MKLDTSTIYSGFQILQYAYVEEITSDVYLLEHRKSGARLLYLGNSDDNKVFSIAFRTPPADDSGVAHILEHSSLCGSRKYRLKEPFVELAKGSLNTFLNAMTYPDKTIYPVASRNAKDFRNLMDVYLDAVFYPLIYENKFTLRQEGWHYNLESPDGELTWNGVVYNEMKGVYSSADALLEHEGMKALFPDTAYRFESGGHPDAIPELTQAAFESFHRTYYTPENSYIYLYGDMDNIDTLAYLDRAYLSAFTKTGSVNSAIALQPALPRTQEVTACYPTGAGESCAAKTYHELSIVTGTAMDVKTSMALRLLEAVLLEVESSPLRRALMQAGVGQNISGSFVGSLQQPVFAIRVSGSEPQLRDKFVSVIYKTLQDLTINGLDRQLLEGALNSLEFKLREADFGGYPQGLIYNLGIMDNWLYGGDPMASLKYNDILRELRAGIGQRYYESLIENYLLDNTHKVIVSLLPSPGKEEADREETARKLAAVRSGMNRAELQSLADECAELHRLQALPDSPEALAAIPVLQRGDIRREIEKIAVRPEHHGDNLLLYLPAAANKIDYYSCYFDITGVPGELLPYCYLLTDLLGKFNTERYSYQEVATASLMYTGGIALGVQAYSAAADADSYKICFSVKARALHENLPRMLDILRSVLLESRLEDVARFEELVAEIKSDWDSNFFNRGQSMAIARLYAYCSAAARVNEQDYFSYYQFIKDLTENFATRGKAALAVLGRLMRQIFQKNGNLLLYACDEDVREDVRGQMLAFMDTLPAAGLAGLPPDVLPAPGHNEGIVTVGKVQYVVAGGNFRKHGHAFTGAMCVLETLLRYEYLWTRIRIQGGAYGATARFEMNGLGIFASYRDPKLLESLDVYRQLPEWLEQLAFTERELDKYVIGTISSMDAPLTISMRLDRAAAGYLKHISDEARQKVRNEVLDITNADLQALGRVVRDMLSDGYLCVVGGKQAIEAQREIFGSIINA